MSTTDSTTNKLVLWREECFQSIGFSETEAEQLAQVIVSAYVPTKVGLKKYDAPLHWGNVKKMLEAGATRPQVLAIYL